MATVGVADPAIPPCPEGRGSSPEIQVTLRCLPTLVAGATMVFALASCGQASPPTPSLHRTATPASTAAVPPSRFSSGALPAPHAQPPVALPTAFVIQRPAGWQIAPDTASDVLHLQLASAANAIVGDIRFQPDLSIGGPGPAVRTVQVGGDVGIVTDDTLTGRTSSPDGTGFLDLSVTHAHQAYELDCSAYPGSTLPAVAAGCDTIITSLRWR
jgi:hypothetical protein